MRIRLTGAGRMAMLARRVAALKDDPTSVCAGPVRDALEEEYQRSFVEQRGPVGGRWRGHKRPLGHPVGVDTTALATPNVTKKPGPNGWIIVIRPRPKYAVFFNRRRTLVPLSQQIGRWTEPVDGAIQTGLRRLAARIGGHL